jgi:hypothetical protein
VESVPATFRTLTRTPHRRGFPGDVAERGLRPDLLLEVDVLLLETRLEGGDLLVGTQVLNGQRDLLGDRSEQRGLARAVPAGLAAPDVHRPYDFPFDHHGS